MVHLKTLSIKFIVISIVVLSLFSIFNVASLGNLLLISVFTTIATYLLGDMVILKRFGNIVAAVADFGLAFLFYWSLSSFFIGGSEAIIITSLAAAFFTACVEPFIHEYISIHLFPNRVHQSQETINQLQTEWAEEMLQDDNNTKDD